MSRFHYRYNFCSFAKSTKLVLLNIRAPLLDASRDMRCLRPLTTMNEILLPSISRVSKYGIKEDEVIFTWDSELFFNSNFFNLGMWSSEKLINFNLLWLIFRVSRFSCFKTVSPSSDWMLLKSSDRNTSFDRLATFGRFCSLFMLSERCRSSIPQ